MTEPTRTAPRRPATERAPDSHATPTPRHLHLLPATDAGEDQHTEDEAAALMFDVQDDFEALVPMPHTIPANVRRALTLRFAQRFEHYADLHRYLHEESAALDGQSPFEALIAGRGRDVLSALRHPGSMATAAPPRTMRLVR